MKFWLWCISWGYSGNSHSRVESQNFLIAPNDMSEVLQLAIKNSPTPVPNGNRHYDFVLIGIERREQIAAQWEPVYQGPRAPTEEEQAMAEVELALED